MCTKERKRPILSILTILSKIGTGAVKRDLAGNGCFRYKSPTCLCPLVVENERSSFVGITSWVVAKVLV